MLSVPKSHFASITSRPLLTSVDESIVTFAPIFQLGVLMRPQVLCQPVLHVFSQRTDRPMPLKVFSLLRVCPYSLEVTEISHCVHVYRKYFNSVFLCQIHNDMTACYKRFLIRKSNIFLCLYCLYVGSSPEIPTTAVTTVSARQLLPFL